MNICICITEFLCCTPEKKHNNVNQPFSNKILKKESLKLRTFYTVMTILMTCKSAVLKAVTFFYVRLIGFKINRLYKMKVLKGNVNTSFN